MKVRVGLRFVFCAPDTFAGSVKAIHFPKQGFAVRCGRVEQRFLGSTDGRRKAVVMLVDGILAMELVDGSDLRIASIGRVREALVIPDQIVCAGFNVAGIASRMARPRHLM